MKISGKIVAERAMDERFPFEAAFPPGQKCAVVGNNRRMLNSSLGRIVDMHDVSMSYAV